MTDEDHALKLFCAEYEAVPPITRLDEYIHLEEQLKQLRIQGGGKFQLHAFAIQMAVFMRLREYDEKLGLPLSIMPRPDGSMAAWEFEHTGD